MDMINRPKLFYYIKDNKITACTEKENQEIIRKMNDDKNYFTLFRPKLKWLTDDMVLIGFHIENEEFICTIGNLAYAYKVKLTELKLIAGLVKDEEKLIAELIARRV